MYVAREFITGWYYRVIEPGFIEAGDGIELLERQDGSFSIVQFWQIQLVHQPSTKDLLGLAAIPGLSMEWQRRLTERARWLQNRETQG